MSQKNRINMLADIVNNIYNNLINFITGQNAQDRFVNLLDSAPNILSDKDQANGYVGTDANNEMFSGYYNENITRADLITALGANLAVGYKFYQINDAVGSTKTLLVMPDSNISMYPIGVDLNTGETGVYDIALDTFTPIGGGNANITTITAAALAALETAGTLSLTTLYVVTDATPYKVMVSAEAVNMIGKSARIIDDVYGGHGHYDPVLGAFIGTLWDINLNMYNGNSTGNILATSSGNIFNQSTSNDLTGSSGNIFNPSADANILVDSGNNLFDINSSSNTLTTCAYNTFESNCQNIILDTASYNIFKTGVTNFNSVNINFDYCIVAGTDYSVVDFTNAAQLFGRGVYWEINKVLGTDLLEVTFDAYLSTAQTGTYDTSTDTFTPIAAGTGDVVGPASAVDNNIAVFDGITGKLIKDGGATVASLVPYTGATADVDLDIRGLDAKFIKIKGAAGDGKLGLKHQSSPATAAASESIVYADTSGNPKWKNDGNAVESIVTGSGTNNEIAAFNSTGSTITSLAVATYPSLTELSYVKGVTSAIQTQLNALANTQTLTCIGLVITTVNDATNYHIGTIAATPSGTDARRAFKPTADCTVTAASLTLEQVTNGSNETVSVYLRNVTDATETLIGTFTSDFGASTTLKTLFSGLSIALVTTKDYTIRITTPTWVTNPSQWIPSVTLQMTL